MDNLNKNDMNTIESKMDSLLEGQNPSEQNDALCPSDLKGSVSVIYPDIYAEAKEKRKEIDYGPEKYKDIFGDFSDFTAYPNEYYDYTASVCDAAIEEENNKYEKRRQELIDEANALYKDEELKPSHADYRRFFTT